MNFRKSQVTNLGQLQTIGGDVHFNKSQITNLGQLQTIDGDVYLKNSKLKPADFENINVRGEIHTNNV